VAWVERSTIWRRPPNSSDSAATRCVLFLDWVARTRWSGSKRVGVCRAASVTRCFTTAVCTCLVTQPTWLVSAVLRLSTRSPPDRWTTRGVGSTARWVRRLRLKSFSVAIVESSLSANGSKRSSGDEDAFDLRCNLQWRTIEDHEVGTFSDLE